MNDIELTEVALQACGYRVHIKERNGTRWVTAVKGLDVQYKHWHPLTNINQAMQLLVEAPCRMQLCVTPDGAWIEGFATSGVTRGDDLIKAQCRAIINACAVFAPM